MEDLTFGEQVKIILGRKGMTIKELAEIIEQRTGKKMSRQNLTQRLGRDNFQEQDMRMIADILGCPFHLSIMTSEVQAASAGVVQTILAERAQKAQKSEKHQQKHRPVHKARTDEAVLSEKDAEDMKGIIETEPYQMSLFDDVMGQSSVVEPVYEAEDKAEIYEGETAVEEAAVEEATEVEAAEEVVYEERREAEDSVLEASTYEEEYTIEDDVPAEEVYEEQNVSEEIAYQEEPVSEEEFVSEEEPASEAYDYAARQAEEPAYEADQYAYAAQPQAEVIPEEAEEVDMTIGELYEIHEGLTELEESVEAGEPVEAIKEELEKPVEQIKPKKERFRTGGIFLRKRGINLQKSSSKTEPSREESVREEPVRTSFTETVPVKEEKRRTVPTPDSDDFEPVIKYDDVEEDLEQGEINPYTGREYQSNSVRMHPNRIGYVQVYDRTSHKWTDMTEWAFLGYQERKKALLGKDYEPPIYLD